MFARPVPVNINLQIDDTLILDATAGLCLGLIVSELLTNSNRHAFPEQPLPRITLAIVCAGKDGKMHYRDNGKGISTHARDSFGLTLISDLTRQLRGHYSISQNNGLHYFFNFPNLV